MSYDSEILFLNRAKFVMSHLGVWIPSINESFFFKLIRYFMISLQYLFLLFQSIYIIQVWGDLQAVCQAFYLFFTQACLCFKVSVFHINMDKLRELLKQMNSPIFEPKSEAQKTILHNQAARIKRMLLSFMISSQATCGLWALKPLFDNAGNHDFPFDMWMPFSRDTPQYEIGFAFQLVTISMSAYMYFGVDSVALSMIIFACAQLDIIKDKIMNISPIDVLKGADPQKIYMDNHKVLIECVKHYQAVYVFTKLVETTYHTYLLFQITGSVGLFCMTALRILGVDWKSVQFFSSLSYLLVMLMQLFVCCWCGHELTATSENLHTVMYKCMWYEQYGPFKRDLQFAMMRMSRSMVLRAGYYITLSRQTFVSILRMSYSYFAVLVNQDN
ncbi:hypothetical protein ACJJTC_015825 [Scirpophaga incertulas]